MHKKLVDRLIAEFGAPDASLRWTITGPGRVPMTVQVDHDREGCSRIRVWVFDPAKGAAAAILDEVSCDEEIDRFVARIRTDFEHPQRW